MINLVNLTLNGKDRKTKGDSMGLTNYLEYFSESSSTEPLGHR